MKIYFDNIVFSIQKVGGVSAVWSELIKRVHQQYIAGYLEYGYVDNIFRKHLFLPKEKIILYSGRYIKLQKLFDVKIKDDEKFIFHSSAYRICKLKNALNIVTVHDFIDEYYNKNFIKRNLIIARKKYCISKADAVICVSENTKNNLLNFFPNIIGESKIFVIHNGKSEKFKREAFSLKNSFPELNSQEYILFVGNRSGYKNFRVIVEAISLFHEKKLVIVGGGNLKSDEKCLLDCTLGDSDYFHYQMPENESLNLLYNNAYCFIYPSLYEGFGIPVIEAQSAGCPVVASNKSSLPEILKDTAILLDEITPHAISQALRKLENIDVRNSIIQKGLKNANNYSWDIMAEKYIDVYLRVWNKSDKNNSIKSL
jgi:mannosyltransferase